MLNNLQKFQPICWKLLSRPSDWDRTARSCGKSLLLYYSLEFTWFRDIGLGAFMIENLCKLIVPHWTKGLSLSWFLNFLKFSNFKLIYRVIIRDLLVPKILWPFYFGLKPQSLIYIFFKSARELTTAMVGGRWARRACRGWASWLLTVSVT